MYFISLITFTNHTSCFLMWHTTNNRRNIYVSFPSHKSQYYKKFALYSSLLSTYTVQCTYILPISKPPCTLVCYQSNIESPWYYWCCDILIYIFLLQPKKLQLHRRVLAFFLSCTAGLIHDEPGQYSIRLSEFFFFCRRKAKNESKKLKNYILTHLS